MSNITELSVLFTDLFHPKDKGEPPIKGHPRLMREDYFQMFFPEELCRQYLGKTKSNLSWFFNNDEKNKAIKRTLIRMMTTSSRQIISAMHQKCRVVLWPQAQHPAFDANELWNTLRTAKISPKYNLKFHITEETPNSGTPSKLRSFFEADPSAALARLILTLAIISDAPEDMINWIWDSAPKDSSYSFLSKEDSVESKIRYGKLLYLSGQHKEAFEKFEEAAEQLDRPAETPEESALYCQLGEMLAKGDGHFIDVEAACRYLKLGCLPENPEAYYLLAQYTEDEQARAPLEKAADLGYVPALRELGNAWYSGNSRLGLEKDIEKARHYFHEGMASHSEDGAYCAYMLGRIYESSNDIPSAINAYKIAQENGNAEAYEHLVQLNWTSLLTENAEPGNREESVRNAPLRYCLVNTPTGNNRVLLDALQGHWQVTVCALEEEYVSQNAGVTILQESQPNAAQALARLGEALFTPEQETFPELVISLLSGDQQDNLYQAISILNTLQQIAARLGERKWDLVEQVSIYVEAEHDYAALMLDAAFSGLRKLYFRVRLCDPARDCADQLLTAAPLFLPCIRTPETEHIHMVVLSTSNAAMSIVRKAISLPLSDGHPVTISVFGENAAAMEQRFAELCPGIEGASPTIRRTIPTFHECDLSQGQVTSLLRRLKARRSAQEIDHPTDTTPEELLGRGNYYVIATDDDTLNIRLGAHLRSELLKLDPTFTNRPFIAVYVHNPVAAWLAGNLSADSKLNRHSWHSQYDLFCFGAATQYTYTSLKNDLTEHRAQAIHLQYAGSPQDRSARHEALTSYYNRQHNRDSSRAMAQHMSYRLFAAGIVLPDWKMYGMPDEEAKLGAAYTQWLSTPSHLEAAARLEHERWNCFMLAAGWEQASPSQVSTYVQLGNPGQQLYLAKLHPFICEWETLESGELIREVEEAIHSRLPEKKVHDPRIADEEAAQSTADILAIH